MHGLEPEPNEHIWGIVLIAVIAFCVGVLLHSTVGYGHEATDLNGNLTGWEYDPDCCNGEDCVTLPDDRVTMNVVDGKTIYEVRLRPGDHPHFPEGGYFWIAASSSGVMPSGDNYLHACVVNPQIQGPHSDVLPWMPCLYLRAVG